MKLPVILKYLIVSFTFLFLFNCNKKNDEKSKNLIPNSSSISTLIEEAGDNNLPEKSRIQRIEKAILLAKESNNDSLEFKALESKMYLFTEFGMDESALNLNREILKRSKDLKNNQYIANSYFLFGNFYYENYNTDSAYYYFNKSKDEFIKLKDKDGIAKNSINLAMILNDVASYFESEKLSLEALSNVKDNPNHPFLTPIYNNLAVSSGSLLNYNEELYWYDKALELTEDPYYIVSIKHNKGVAYTLLKDYDNAINILSGIQDDKILKQYPNVKARILDNLSYAKWLKNSDANVIQDYNEAIKIFIETEDSFGLSTVYDHLFEYYKIINPNKALDYAYKKIEITDKSNNTEGKVNALKRVIVLKPNRKDIESYITLSDSLQHLNSNSIYQFAKLEYDVDANRNKVQSLSLENANKEIDLQRAKISIIITVSILVIATISFFSYTYYIRQKRKQETLETIYETEVKFSQKLHDELANDLFSTITLVDSITFEDQELKNKLIHNLDHIYSQTRNISRENNIIDTKNFKKELDIMLGSFKSDQVNVLSKGIDSINWDEIENQVKILIYRVLMELMTNMKKHSDCSIVVISFSEESNNILDIKYVDNGSISLDETKINKNGLKNVENRIFRLNGNINFDSSRGFKAFIKIPTTKKTKLI
ncbi:tetratricopeptide repeat-containing sensor histidine kinase [Faecalibacter macacae]|uniref:ATP-binding protein n=1 Tax=Faecalibacter macacae TaxID=1859289 RepID=A0A3L9MK86_9FLAO|nr:tetratricopeptide repeat-containing sensor histidine kinase [Faecalibacter macacae]RLZ11714.1 hypothetical protein EAH69_04640 [Faecalibacter macacae]